LPIPNKSPNEKEIKMVNKSEKKSKIETNEGDRDNV
jgi:hypothetical protein